MAQRCTVVWTVSDRDATLDSHEAGLGLDPGPGLRTQRGDPVAAAAAILPWAGTFHAMANRLLRLHAHEAGLGLDRGVRLRTAPGHQVPKRLGFHMVERWQFNFAQVTKSTR